MIYTLEQHWQAVRDLANAVADDLNDKIENVIITPHTLDGNIVRVRFIGGAILNNRYFIVALDNDDCDYMHHKPRLLKTMV